MYQIWHYMARQRRYDRRGAAQAIATDYSQQKHTTWADNYCSIKG